MKREDQAERDGCQAQDQVEHVLARKVTGAPWNRRNLYLPDSLPKAITEPRR